MRQRKRLLSEPTVITTVEQLIGGPFNGYTANYGERGVYYSRYQEMTDFHMKARPFGRGRYGQSPMRKRSAQIIGNYTGVRTNFPWPGETVRLLSPGTQLFLDGFQDSIWNVWSLLPHVDPYGSEMSSYATEARIKFADQMPQQLSIPNFAYEIGEVTSLASSVLEFAKSFSTKSVAGSYLAWEFGGAPLIGDLYAMANLAKTIRLRIEHLKNTWGKETNLSHKVEHLVPFPPIRDWVTSPPGVIGPMGIYETYLDNLSTSVRFFGKLTQRLEGLDTWGGWFRALAAANGFNNPLGVVWETVPFSFVVDWVSNISSLFDRFKAQPFQGEWSVYDVGFTTQLRAQYQVRLRDIQSSELQGLVGRLYVSEEARYLGFPENVASINFAELSPQQLLLAICLGRGIVRF